MQAGERVDRELRLGREHHLRWDSNQITAFFTPPAQRAMTERARATVAEVVGSHAVDVSQPSAVADLIRQAAAR
ncbi:hypothetical protein ACIHFD_36265 [Nonomuraea sp. NPDC051941]|uniref:hypothetical protein n=1 Tax=Nonomuraea sp. NPDC051941 TaxID=3364373 RepID=UPI0037C8ABAF